MKTPKEYDLVTIQDLMKIPESRFGAFLVDLKEWHKLGKQTLKMVNSLAKALGEPSAIGVSMKWIDDGKHVKKIIIKAPEK